MNKPTPQTAQTRESANGRILGGRPTQVTDRRASRFPLLSTQWCSIAIPPFQGKNDLTSATFFTRKMSG